MKCLVRKAQTCSTTAPFSRCFYSSVHRSCFTAIRPDSTPLLHGVGVFWIRCDSFASSTHKQMFHDVNFGGVKDGEAEFFHSCVVLWCHSTLRISTAHRTRFAFIHSIHLYLYNTNLQQNSQKTSRIHPNQRQSNSVQYSKSLQLWLSSSNSV